MNREQLVEDIQRFLDVYKVLSPEAKIRFEGHLDPTLKEADERSRGLYTALLSAARDGLSIEGAISRMEDSCAEKIGQNINLKEQRKQAPSK